MSKKYTKSLFTTGILLIIVIAVVVFGSKILQPKTSVDVSDVVISNPAGSGTVKIGSSQQALIHALGTPKQIAPYTSQASYRQGTVLNYNGARFIFIHNRLTNFEITSHAYNVGLASTHKFNRVGNSKADLPNLKIKQNTAFVNVKGLDAISDQYLEYDLSDSGKLTKIVYSDY